MIQASIEMHIGVIFYAYVLLMSAAISWDRTEFVKNVGKEICPYTNFCHTNATKALKDDSKMACCLPCDCTETCWKEGICCPDKFEPDSVPSSLECRQTMVKQSVYNKLKYNGIKFGIPRYRISVSCPSSEANATVVEKCDAKNISSIEDYIWVSETGSGRIFQNRYCAYCNGVTSFVEWNIRATEPDLLYSNFSFLPQFIHSASLQLTTEVPKREADVAERYKCYAPEYSRCNQTGIT